MTVRVGIVGWGEIGAFHARHLPENEAVLAGVVSRRQNLGLPVPVYRSLTDMLPHVDAVIIAVPNHLHARLCCEAVRAHMPVLVEKPLCISSDELNELETILRHTDVPVHLGYRLRWNPSLLRLRGRLTGIRRIRGIYRIGMNHLADGKDWTRDSTLSGGAFFAIGIHMLDLARWLAGARGEPLTGLTAHADSRVGTADFPLRVSLSGTLPSGIEITAGADLSGDSNSVIDLTVHADRGAYPDPLLPPPQPEDEDIEYPALLDNFIHAVKHGTCDESEIDEILETHRALLTARETAVEEPG